MSCISSFHFLFIPFLPVIEKHSVWEFGGQETGVHQPTVMFVNLVHVSLFLGGKGIETIVAVIFLPLSTRRRGTSRASTGANVHASMFPPSMPVSLRILMDSQYVTILICLLGESCSTIGTDMFPFPWFSGTSMGGCKWRGRLKYGR